MDLLNKAIGIHPLSLQLRLERAEIIAGNLANVDTPGFLARDIDYKSVLADLESSLRSGAGSFARSPESVHQLMYRIPYQASLDGNTAELNIEQAKFAANSMDFQTSLTFLNMKINGLHKAIKGE